ncbi:MAG: MarR family winged helix-turn-helix transcriptional regulator [Dysgonomonas sp.]|jgi:DNA-binding MarR family transcriptional regulator|uniref:MarR family winged helix-turn-helix transcriptional regulator n=1 Tax=unclassified Dysgonomonas TaxID=2630389 RepID=UPI0025C4D70A|nr:MULTISPECIES: MarR family winged helix-turn-helix transcriptional regulator [unclassified Dysgonomonas]MDR1718004.1 MarR family winged helix-turn-helix transcriptional regulator [Prevotella sp.]MDR2001799.1 MarR family winged helix-turn-helix transcriptional regulator [Prevotella sp.]HMM01960.1 MarR family winged helix-turn-helix transcriptional regulator [Dysgonomonas sp.]
MEVNCKLGNPNEEVGYLIWRVSKFWQRGKHKVLDEFGLTSSQMELLGAIYHMSRQQKEATQIVLSQETEIDPMTTSTILRNLEKKGLISRRESVTDTRARIVELTEAGKELFEKAITKVKSGQELLFKNIDVEVLRTQLIILLQEMDRLSKSNN